MLIYIKKNNLFLNKEKKIKYLFYKGEEGEEKEIEKILTSKENTFNKNELILKKLKTLFEEKELTIKGIGNEKEIKTIKTLIKKGNFTDIKNYNKEEFEEITTYPIVLEELKKRVSENYTKTKNLLNLIDKYINANKTKEEEIIIKKERNKKLVEAEIKKIELLYENDKTTIEKDSNRQIKEINKKIKILEKEHKLYTNTNQKIKKENKELENVDIEIKLLKKKLQILNLKEKNNENCWDIYKIILLILTLGLIYWTDILNCKRDINSIKKRINKIHLKRETIELEIEKLKSKLKDSKFLDEKKELEFRRDKILNEKEEKLNNLKHYLKLLDKKKEELLTLESEISNLKNLSLNSVKSYMEKIKETYTKTIFNINKEIESLKNQTIEKKMKYKAIEIELQ